MTEAEGAVRRIRDGSPTVLLQRVGVAAYSVVNGVLATPTDTYLERVLTVVRAYEKVCTTSLRVVSPQAPPTLQSRPSQSLPKRHRHEELLLPGQSQSQSQLLPDSRGFLNQRPPSPMTSHIRDDPELGGSPFDVFTGGLEFGWCNQ